jgi:hypothetical protein
VRRFVVETCVLEMDCFLERCHEVRHGVVSGSWCSGWVSVVKRLSSGVEAGTHSSSYAKDFGALRMHGNIRLMTANSDASEVLP